MTSLSWWRSWHGAPMDNKWPVIAARSGVKVGIVSAVAWALFDYASQHKNRGSVDGFDTEVYSVYSGFSEVEVAAVIQAMTDKGIIIDGMLANWEKRQPKREDDSKERVAKFRAKKKDVTQCNAENVSVTIDSVSVSDSLSVSGLSINSEYEPEPETNMSRWFEGITGISAYNPEKWLTSCQSMVRNKVTADILQRAVDILRDKRYSISGPWSVEKTAIGLVSENTEHERREPLQVDENGRVL
jgi:hypothetical protein